MKVDIVAAAAVSIVTVLIISVATAFLGFICITWGLALTGYMSGQAEAVKAAMATFSILASVIGFVTMALSAVCVYILTSQRKWNAFGAAALSICVAGAVSVAGQGLALLVGFIVAGQLKTI
jgi:hypothetical protein